MAFLNRELTKKVIVCKLCGKEELCYPRSKYCSNCRNERKSEIRREATRRYYVCHINTIRTKQKEQYKNRQIAMSMRHDIERFNGHRKEVLKRDTYSCQFPNCHYQPKSMRTGWLVVHHIDLDEYNNNPHNLITLCRTHHKWLHNVLEIIRKYPKIFPPQVISYLKQNTNHII